MTNMTPEEFAVQVADALSVSTFAEARRLVDHARAWSTVFYDGNIPQSLDSQLQRLEKQKWECLTMHDAG
jgi:hypothetical protein